MCWEYHKILLKIFFCGFAAKHHAQWASFNYLDACISVSITHFFFCFNLKDDELDALRSAALASMKQVSFQMENLGFVLRYSIYRVYMNSASALIDVPFFLICIYFLFLYI